MLAAMNAQRPSSPFEELFARHRTAAIPDLWPWQREVLTTYERTAGDVAIDLPTGTGKTLLGLLIGEEYRQRTGGSVAYVAGNKQLAQQVERQARQLSFPVVRFQGSKETWAHAAVRSYNFGETIGVMNYWNYFNASPGVEPAALLLLDDVHLLEQPLRDMYTVAIARADPLYLEILRRIVAICPYYALAEDLLNGVEPPGPPEMVVFPDSADLAGEVGALLDGQLGEGTSQWWAWQQTRHHLDVCCWLVSARAVTFTPYIPPAQTYPHFASPARRVYMSATIGTTDDLRRRIGAPSLEKLSATVQPRQGERFVVISDSAERPSGAEIVESLRGMLAVRPKALWLCARKATAALIVESLLEAQFPGRVRLLEGDNGADELFALDPQGHLVTAGRYDGMDFPEDACRIEVLPEIPVATSDLEEWTSAYLRDADFADARFTQRLAQALGRCNRSENDRAVYVLIDPEFLARLGERRSIDALPDDVRADVFSAVRRSDDGLRSGLRDAELFLSGSDYPPLPAPARIATTPPTLTGGDEVDGYVALWLEDYARAAEVFDDVVAPLAGKQEHRAFWLSMRALALQLAGRYGDRAATTEAQRALAAAASAGARTTFFTRLRLSASRRSGREAELAPGNLDSVFSAWDRLVSQFGPSGPRFERWSATLLDDLRSTHHDTVARAIARFGTDVLALDAAAPVATSGEHDAEWELTGPPRVLTFEVKLAPTSQRVVNSDIEQAEGATRAVENRLGRPARGLLVTPWLVADPTALQRLDRVRLISRETLVAEAQTVLDLLREYRRGWGEDAGSRSDRRQAVESQLPAVDWLWQAQVSAVEWVQANELLAARHRLQ